MDIALIAARGKNGVIGRDGDLPWSVPADTAYYHDRVRGAWVLAGRKTYESAEGHRPPVAGYYILTRQTDYSADGQVVVHDVEAALQRFRDDNRKQLFVLGGGEVYAQMLPYARRLLITEIDASPEGDAYFPKFESQNWRKVWEEEHAPDGDNEYAYTFTEWQRIE